ncbi:long-chain fatty acid--CoA ligase [Streptomyces sp. NBC_00536]|uniref:class I adenylate-forming enzyme family protein n=1 Tax=Streptomyces sp. NBC_00536 TaxID=2975769 RepID=UPI002E7FD420|nr:long-chain fatty acid--CoA ligase [Streptomyces sp. NBC_00536]WUC80841.1 long-chain fatty acid--CoA ligase [Streptomyces sp. NBC_00536]
MTSWFFDRMRSFGEADAIVFNGVSYSYAQLARLTGEWERFLDRGGVHAGQVVALEGVSSVEACAGLLALIERGAIIVPMTPLPPAKRAEFHEVAEVETVISIDSQQWRRSIEITGRNSEHELYDQLRTDGVPGLVLFSSGTTGRSKASVLDFSKVLSKYGPPTRPRRTLGFLNLDHIGGINTLLHTLSQGGALVTIDERTPDKVCAAIESNAIQILPTTPTFLNMLLISRAYERHDLSSLQLVSYGTEPMPEGTLTRLGQALPQTRLKQTYGLSELGIMPTKSRDDGSLWVKLGGEGFSYRIEDGILWIRSDMAMLGYLNAPAPFDDDGFFNTQDAVETDGDYVRILGRKSELINVAGEKVYPSEVENVLLELEYVADAVVSGRPSHVTGQVVKAVVRLTAPVDDERATARRIREYCAQRLEAFKVPVVVEVTTADTHSDRFKKIRSAV